MRQLKNLQLHDDTHDSRVFKIGSGSARSVDVRWVSLATVTISQSNCAALACLADSDVGANNFTSLCTKCWLSNHYQRGICMYVKKEET